MSRTSQHRCGPVAFESLEGRQLMALVPGTLDTSFSTDGMTNLPVPQANKPVYASAVVQPDGKTLVATLGSATSNDQPDSYFLFRYDVNGLLDPTFSGDGMVAISVRSGGYVDLALQTDGKVLLAGEFQTADHQERGLLARFNTNGSLDATFDGDGIIVTPAAWGVTEWNAVATAPGGKIVVAGRTGSGQSLIARYNGNGMPDTTLDGDGRRGITVANKSFLNDVAVMTDGRIVAAGQAQDASGFTSGDTLVVRLNSSGSYDSTFSGDGIHRWDYSNDDYDTINAIHVYSDGRILAAGQAERYTNDRPTLWRYKANGSLDTTFSSDGIAYNELSNQPYTHVVVQKTGHVLALNADAFRIDRFNANGTIDPTWTQPAMGISGDPYRYAYALAPSGLDKAILVGKAQSTLDGKFGMKVARLHAGSVPYAPKDALAFSLSTSEIRLYWTDDSANESIFQIQYATKADFSDALLALSSKNTITKLFAGLKPGTTYYFRVLAANSYGKSAWSPVTSIATKSLPTLAIRIDAGGNGFTDSSGNLWSADKYFSGGITNDDGAAVANTVNDPIYSSRRGGTSFQYAIPVTNGTYTLKLHFAEMHYTAAGQRKFDVQAEGTTILNDFDIYAAAGGGKTAIVKTFTVSVTDGTLNLNFIGVLGSAVVSAIEVLPVA